MKQSHLATAAFWIGLVGLYLQAANAQMPPRPPMPIPVRRPRACCRRYQPRSRRQPRRGRHQYPR